MLWWESEDGRLRWRAVRVSNALGAQIEYSIDGEPFHSFLNDESFPSAFRIRNYYNDWAAGTGVLESRAAEFGWKPVHKILGVRRAYRAPDGSRYRLRACSNGQAFVEVHRAYTPDENIWEPSDDLALKGIMPLAKAEKRLAEAAAARGWTQEQRRTGRYRDGANNSYSHIMAQRG